MKILHETNVLTSAFVFGGKAGQLLEKLFDSDFELLVSDYVNKEFHDKLNEKWPNKASKVYTLYRTLPFSFCSSSDTIGALLRDPKDNPVLSDAMMHKVDVILTGDRDFLEANLDYPPNFFPCNDA
jgi:putative PIN family toxin of toxin-antitoxin system